MERDVCGAANGEVLINMVVAEWLSAKSRGPQAPLLRQTVICKDMHGALIRRWHLLRNGRTKFRSFRGEWMLRR